MRDRRHRHEIGFFFIFSVVVVVVVVVLFICLLLFDFVFLEQDPFLNDRIVFDKGHLVLRVGDIFSCCVEKSGSRRGKQFDGNGFALPAGHQRYRGMHGVVSALLRGSLWVR